MAGTYRDNAGREVYGENNAGDVGPTYQLANNITIAANSAGPIVTPVRGGSYIFDVQFTGTSLQLRALGADNTTYRTVTAPTGSGSTGVVIGEGSTIQLYNPNASAVTGVYANLS